MADTHPPHIPSHSLAVPDLSVPIMPPRRVALAAGLTLPFALGHIATMGQLANASAILLSVTGIDCSVGVNNRGCEGAFLFVPASGAPASRAAAARSFLPRRNAPLESALMAAGVPPASTAAAQQYKVGEEKVLAAAMQRLVADPSPLGAVLSAMTRTMTSSVPADSMAGTFPRRRPAPITAGTYEFSVSYSCLAVEQFPDEVTSSLGSSRQGNKSWVAANWYDSAGFPEMVVGFAPPATGATMPAVLGCGTTHVDRRAILTAVTSDQPARVVPVAYDETCDVQDSTTAKTVGVRCTLYERRGLKVGHIEISAPWTAESDFFTPALIAAAVNRSAAPVVAPDLVRLRVWRLNRVQSLSATEAATASAARETVAAEAAEALPRLDSTGDIVLFTLVPAGLSWLLGAPNVVKVYRNWPRGGLPKPGGPGADWVRMWVLVVELLATGIALYSSTKLLNEFGRDSVRGWVALEEGTVVYRAARPELGQSFLRLTLQPVVESVMVTIGSTNGRVVARASVCLAAMDVAWDVTFIAVSVMGWRLAKRAADNEATGETEEEEMAAADVAT